MNTPENPQAYDDSNEKKNANGECPQKKQQPREPQTSCSRQMKIITSP